MSIAIWKLQRRIRSLERRRRAHIKRANGCTDAVSEIDASFFAAYRELRDDLSQRMTAELLSQAESLRLPAPPYTQDSEDYWADRRGILTLRPHAFKGLRDAIREEKKARFDAFARWVTLIGALVAMCVGLLGALIGLLSVLKRP